MAGFGATLRLLWPFVVSALRLLDGVRHSHSGRGREFADRWRAIRGAVGSLLLVFLVGYWVKVRDRVRRKFKAFLSEGRAQALGAR